MLNNEAVFAAQPLCYLSQSGQSSAFLHVTMYLLGLKRSMSRLFAMCRIFTCVVLSLRMLYATRSACEHV